MIRLNLPLALSKIKDLKPGGSVLLNGKIFTVRDQAHKRLVELIKEGKPLPINLKDAVFYYCGPTKTPKGKTIGACGPTTASRMDEFTPILLKAGLRAMVGKGRRSEEVVNAVKKYKALYFLTYAGCGALLSKYVKNARPVAYKELGPEAIYELEVKDFPAIVAIDSRGRNIYKISR